MAQTTRIPRSEREKTCLSWPHYAGNATSDTATGFLRPSLPGRWAITLSYLLGSQHSIVLQGLLIRKPELALSDLIGIALEPFCFEHREAANETKIFVETSVDQQEQAPV